jgi:hypothetical protein
MQLETSRALLSIPHCTKQEEGGVMQTKTKLNSVALVRKRTLPTGRPPLVVEVSANLYGERVLRGQHNEFLRPLISDLYSALKTEISREDPA